MTGLDGRLEISDLPIFRSAERPNGPKKNKPNRSPEMLRAEMNADWRRCIAQSTFYNDRDSSLDRGGNLSFAHQKYDPGSDGSSMARLGNIATLLTSAWKQKADDSAPVLSRTLGAVPPIRRLLSPPN